MLKNLPQIQMLEFCKSTLLATHPLKLLDKVCKYEMGLASIVEDIDQTWFCPQIDGQRDGRMEGQMHGQMDACMWNQYTPAQLEVRDIITRKIFLSTDFRMCSVDPPECDMKIHIKSVHTHSQNKDTLTAKFHTTPDNKCNYLPKVYCECQIINGIGPYKLLLVTYTPRLTS